jgi:hypothetical protein
MGGDSYTTRNIMLCTLHLIDPAITVNIEMGEACSVLCGGREGRIVPL